jgi:hypothetical protein
VKDGFDLNARWDGYVIKEEQMVTVRHIFLMAGVQVMSHNAIKRAFERERLLTPGGGSIGIIRSSGIPCSTTFSDLTPLRR